MRLVAILLLGCASALLTDARAAEDSGLSQGERARKKAVDKRRRVIFNCDAGRLWMTGTGTPKGFLAPRIKPLVGTQVDTIFLDVIAGDAPVYASKVQPVYGIAQGRDALPNLKSLIEAGHCPLRIVTDFAHQNDMEVFASIRMNDVHDSFIEGHIATWKKEHPEMLVDKTGSLPTMQLYVTALDFARQAVRDRKFEIIEEVCERYEVDGIELDYIRHPVLFSRTMRGLPVTEHELLIMTSFTRRVRQHLDEVAVRHGRPLLLAVRVPDTCELARNVGLDVKTWLKEDLLDILVAGGGYGLFTLPVAEWTAVAHRYDVPVYPCINQGPARNISQGALLEGVRAMAANWYRAGADGVYTFNLFAPFDDLYGETLAATRREVYACLNEIGDPTTLVRKNKLFSVDGMVYHHYTFITSKTPLPLSLTAEKVHRVSLLVGDDVEAAAREKILAQLQLKLSLRGPVEKDKLLVKLNNQPLTDRKFITVNAKELEHQISFPLDVFPLKNGENVLEASMQGPGQRSGQSVQLVGVHLRVTYK